MALREFTDGGGVRWRVWKVIPLTSTRGPENGRISMSGPVAGWLCFERDGEKRRLTPVPDGWEALEEHDLCALLATAERVRRIPRPQVTEPATARRDELRQERTSAAAD